MNESKDIVDGIRYLKYEPESQSVVGYLGFHSQNANYKRSSHLLRLYIISRTTVIYLGVDKSRTLFSSLCRLIIS